MTFHKFCSPNYVKTVAGGLGSLASGVLYVETPYHRGRVMSGDSLVVPLISFIFCYLLPSSPACPCLFLPFLKFEFHPPPPMFMSGSLACSV
ncbi:hypothetical protein JB92DRAFT_3015510, partial [Gautieria morchelliformis]